MPAEVFPREEPRAELGAPIMAIYGRKFKPAKGEVGIEVEVEGNKFPKTPGQEHSTKAHPLPDWKYWSYCRDGSLRGQDSAEYVLTSPVMFDQIPEAINELKDRLTQFGSVLSESNRTSVHVHLNCQNFHLNRLASFCALFFCFEEILTEWCGDHRVGNLFCLRGKDAPAIISRMKQFIASNGRHADFSEGLHYSGLNAHALTKFGSLEVRTMRGPTDLSLIVIWVSILERLYKLSEAYTDPRDIPAQFSMQGPLSFFESVLGEHSLTVRSGVGFNDERIRDSMYEGIRLAQDICYCRDWDNFKAMEIEADPFGRDVRKIHQSLMNAYGGGSASSEYDTTTQMPMALTSSSPSPTTGLSINAEVYSLGNSHWHEVTESSSPLEPSQVEESNDEDTYFEDEYDIEDDD